MIEIWTDGGCRFDSSKGSVKPTDSSAYASLLIYKNHEKEVSGGALGKTNSYMEVRAVLEGLRQLKRYDIPVTLYTDSMYVVNTLGKQWYLGWAMNGWRTSSNKEVKHKELWEEIVSIWDKLRIARVEHVKGHSGVENNERVDLLVNYEMDALEARSGDYLIVKKEGELKHSK